MVSYKRTKNTIRNMAFGSINKVINLVLPFVIRTIIIYQLGADYAGLGSLFTSILQVLSVAELGFSSAIIFSLYKPIADDNREEICEWLTLYRKIYHIVGTVILCGGLLVLPFLKFMIKSDCPNDINLYILYLLYLLNSVISYFAFSYKNVLLIGYQRRDILNNIELVVVILRSMIQIVVLVSMKDFYAYVIWIPISTFAINIVVEIITRKRYPELVCKNNINTGKLKSISDQIKGAAIGKMSLVARNSFDSIILSAKCGLLLVTIYSNYYFIFSAIGQILGVIIQSMAASVGNSLVTESTLKNYEDHNKFDFIFMWIVGWCTVCLFCLYQPFMKLWVGDKLTAPFASMILFCLYFYVSHLAEIRSIYSEAAGLWWKFRYITVGEMAANLILNIILGGYYEMNGILVATIITAFLSSFIGISIVTFRNYFRKSIVEYFLNNAVYFIVTLAAITVTYAIVALVETNGLYGLVVKGLICVVIPNVLYAALYYFVPKYRAIMLWGLRRIVQISNKIV